MARDAGRHHRLSPPVRASGRASTRGRLSTDRCPPAWPHATLKGGHAAMAGAAVQVVHERCAGLDVHKKTVVACVVVSDPTADDGARATVRTFETMTSTLEQLAAWLDECGVTHVVMEATGAYWKPVYNVLEAHGGFTLLVVNAEHFRV